MPTNGTWKVLHDAFTTQLVKLESGPFGYEDANGGGNCIRYRNGIAAVFNGTFSAAWDSTNPLHDRLRIVARDLPSIATTAGPSPLRIEFGGLDPDTFALYITTENDQGVITGQAVELSWTITFQGADVPERIERASCG